ncbi:MAG: GldG family protein, partial [Treponema sp.]|nr:GldG family protein [Treponema sp.]
MILKIKAEILSLFKRNLFCLCINMAFYAAWILMIAIVGYRFFFQQHFFSSGTSSMQPFFSSLPYVSILVFPLLTLLLTDEKVEALFPFGRFTLNLVKLFSLVIAFFAMLLPLIAIPLCVSFFGDIDIGSLFTGFTGIILYSFVAFSLTLLISSLCEKNVVAFLLSAVVLAVIDSAHLFPVYTGVTGPFVSLMQEISFAWHFDSFGKGILDTRDIVFFVVFSVFFVFLASFIPSVRTEDKRYKGVFIPLVVNLILLLLLGNRVYIRADLSKEKQFTISTYSENTLKNVEEPLRITYCVSPELSRLYPQVKDVEDYLFMYASSKYADRLSVSIVNPSSKKG